MVEHHETCLSSHCRPLFVKLTEIVFQTVDNPSSRGALCEGLFICYLNPLKYKRYKKLCSASIGYVELPQVSVFTYRVRVSLQFASYICHWNAPLWYDEASQCSLFQVLIYERVMNKDERYRRFLPEDVESECLRVWHQMQSTRPPLSEAKLVCQTLEKMGYVACDHYFVEDIPLQITSAIPQDGSQARYAVETSTDVLSNGIGQQCVLTGRHRWREAMLTATGWGIIRVKLNDFLMLESEEMRTKYLESNTMSAGAKKSHEKSP